MAKIELYTFGEVVKVLGINSNELNSLISQGKLTPVRHQGRLKFKKFDVDELKETMFQKTEENVELTLVLPLEEDDKKVNDEYYSWDQVLTKLQIEGEELYHMIQEGEINLYQIDNLKKFKKEEVDEIENSKMTEYTIMAPRQIKTPSSPVDLQELSISNDDLISPINAVLEYYSLDQVLSHLQMEKEGLDALIEGGEISVYHDEGKIKFDKKEIDALKQGRMIEATVVMEPSAPIEEEDEEIQPILISGFSDPSISAVQIEPEDDIKEDFYTFDEALYELQIDGSSLKKMIAKQEIEATKGENGVILIRKSEIDRIGQKIEPTVILPEDDIDYSEEEDEKTENFAYIGKDDSISDKYMSIAPVEEEEFDEKPKPRDIARKSFYNFEEASVLLEVSLKKIKELVGSGKLKSYRYLGEPHIKRVDILKWNSKAKKEKKQRIPEKKEVVPQAIKKVEEGYYNIDEALSALQIDEKELKKMVARGEISAVRIDKKYKFKKGQIDNLREQKMEDATFTLSKEDLDKHIKQIEIKSPFLKKSKALDTAKPETPKDYTINEARKFLEISISEMDQILKDKKLKRLANNKFDIEEVKKLKEELKKQKEEDEREKSGKEDDNVELTVVLPLFEEEDEDDDFTFIPKKEIDQSPAHKAKPKPQIDTKPKVSITDREAEKMKKEYYTFNQVLRELQMEGRDLEDLLSQGIINYIEYQGQKMFRKVDIDNMKTGKMIEPTVMVENDDGGDILEEEDEDFF